MDKDTIKLLIDKEIDADGDGKITFKEFNKFFKQFKDWVWLKFHYYLVTPLLKSYLI